MRAWMKMFVVVLLALFMATGCLNVARRGTDAPTAPVATSYTTDGNAPFVSVFVVHQASSHLVPVSVSRKLDGSSPVEQAVFLINGGFVSPGFRLPGGPEARIVGVSHQGSTLEVEMTGAFQAWVSRNQAEQRTFIGAVVLTLTTFADVEAVRLVIAGRPVQGVVGGFNLSHPLARPSAINSVQLAEPHVVLYARMPDRDLLVPITVPVPRREPAMALQALLNFPPSDGLVSPVPRGVQFRGISVENGVAIVNLDKTVVNLFLRGAFHEQIVVDALVQTLLEFPQVKKVQFLVDGRVLGPLSANIDLSAPIGRTPINHIVLPQ
ncbi:MAG: hypothetical protein DDT36_00493 [Firmicutes bacterium]|nr:hypothetical protein [Bacillota bacterium]